jgi:DNA-binding transcriptional regulator LsrR (DeoR family)
MATREELRLIARVARLYHEGGLRQSDIAAQLDLSQASVSRLLKRAQDEGIVRITVSAPLGVYPELEDQLRERYGLRDAIVVDGTDEDGALLLNLGAATAYYFETTLAPDEKIGISSWSETLLAMAGAMRPVRRLSGVQVVQILGGLGNPAAASHAAQLTRRLAGLVQGEVVPLPAPGVVGSASTRAVLLDDPYVREVIASFDHITTALVGIGTVEPSPVLARSGNVFTPEELEGLRLRGAVGDVCLRFFDEEGRPVESPLDDRVIGMSLAQLSRVRRSVGVAGGQRKLKAIQGALRGGWINVLVTDHGVAERLVAEEDVPAQPVVPT